MNRLLILLVTALPFITTNANAQVFRCKSPDGKTSYSSTPCPSNHGGGPVKLTDNTLETRALREREAFAREQQEQIKSEQQREQRQQFPQHVTPQATAQRTPSYECRLAIRNANTQTKSATSRKIDAERASAVEVCGYNPWPGPTLSEIDAMNRRSAAIEAQAKAKMNAEEERQRGPAVITSCDSGGCWGTDGHRYNGTGGGFFRDDGKFCTRGGSVLLCN